MTSNVGVRELKSFGTGVGFTTKSKQDQTDETMRSTIEGAMKKVFRPEFLNRIDDVIIFNELEREHIMEIIDLQLKSVFGRIEDKGYLIELSGTAKDYIAEKGYDRQFGARPLQRALQKYLEDPIADEILDGATPGDTLVVDYDEEKDEILVSIRKNDDKEKPDLKKPEETEDS